MELSSKYFTPSLLSSKDADTFQSPDQEIASMTAKGYGKNGPPTAGYLPQEVMGRIFTDDTSVWSWQVEAEEPLAEWMRAVESVGSTITPWKPALFTEVQILEQAPRSFGRVDLMQALNDGKFVAVKRMSVSWTGSGYHDFLSRHPAEEIENPWVDLGLHRWLSARGFPYICDPLGAYQTPEEILVVMELASEGDLFAFASSRLADETGAAREAALRPLVLQICSALDWLHDIFIAHCDLSMENVLLTRSPSTGELQVKLIDFAMAVDGRKLLTTPRGKPLYHSPESHEGVPYNPFLLDCFALGVLIFSAAAVCYPWVSTKLGECKSFDYVQTHSLLAYLKKRKVVCGTEKVPLSKVFSKELIELLQGLLALQPSQRLTIDSLHHTRWLNKILG
eukprot:gb/GFBE01036880.1/.p1 GENE.gb/GFBE01036880.1/~~gb/GFBE01036880.1/.p1  ORF type:complete len:394 (+),score=67.56 gb/GFBE01036880.1/:1-1182(+)